MCRYSPNLSAGKLPLLLLAAGLAGCNDYLSGQDQEPDGPIMVTRLTLFDTTSRDAVVFTDTSVPDCSLAQNQDSLTCTADINRDKYSTKRSPPTPDSGQEIRVVFNKLPLYLGNQDLETRILQPGMAPKFMLADPAVVTATCGDCTGAPPLVESVYLSGSDTTSDPTDPGTHPADIPYGPGILVQVADPTKAGNDPYAALEPDTTYSFQVKAGVAGRNHQAVQIDARAQALLSVKTEPFKVLRAGIGAGTDTWVYDQDSAIGPASYTIMGLATDGVIQLVVNASLDEGSLKATTASATGVGGPVPLKLGLSQLVMKAGKPACDAGMHRALYLFPAGGSWGTSGNVTITVKGADLRDVSQAAGHPAGRHTLHGDLTITATLSGKPGTGDASYKGLVVSKVSATADCPM